MAFTLRIFFVDLVAFVREGNHMWALLPDARNGETAAKEKLEAHHPVVLFLNYKNDDGEWNNIKHLLGLKGVKKSHAWLLNKEDIVIPFQVSYPDGVTADNSGSVSDFPPDRSSAKKFAWVPKMMGIDKRVKLHPKCVDRNAPSDEVVARLLLSQGSLEVEEFVKLKIPVLDPDREARLFGFATYPQGVVSPLSDRCLADVVVATVKMEGTSAEIVTKSHGDGSVVHKMKIESSEGGQYDILVGNLSKFKVDEPFDRWGRHFAFYYDLSETKGKGPIPHLNNLFRGKDPAAIEGSGSDILNHIEEPLRGGIFELFKHVGREVGGFLHKVLAFVRLAAVGANHRPICSFVEFSSVEDRQEGVANER